jgi:hypothetical protein
MQEKQHSTERKPADIPSAQPLTAHTKPQQSMQPKPIAAHAYQRISGHPQSHPHSPADILTLQRSVGNQTVQRLLARTAQREAEPIQRKANQTGLPDRLKAGVESLSGLSLDDVNVHYITAADFLPVNSPIRCVRSF